MQSVRTALVHVMGQLRAVHRVELFLQQPDRPTHVRYIYIVKEVSTRGEHNTSNAVFGSAYLGICFCTR
jgi:hypothetical protein